MAKHYRALVKNALNKNYTVSVWDGEEWQVKRSNKFQTIIDAILSVEFSELRIRNSDGEYIGTVAIDPYLADDETIVDYSYTKETEKTLEEIIPPITF